MDARASVLLKALIKQYVCGGQPVGSRALAKISGLELSPASIRNIMADLEDEGLVVSPHTSAGRIPTARGYRLFVDNLLTVEPIQQQQRHSIEDALQSQQPEQLVNIASNLLSELTHFAGMVVLPQRSIPKIRQIEFLKLAERRILLIIVTVAGEVQNRILNTEVDYQQDDLNTAAQYLNEQCSGCDLSQIRAKIEHDILNLQTDMQPLIESTLTAGSEALESKPHVVISGEKNFLDLVDFSNNMLRLRQLFDLFEQRITLMQLLDTSQQSAGIQIYIGSESGITSLDGCSVVVAPYEINGAVVGSLGVIGPTRMAYEQVIPIVEITAHLLSNALNASA